MIFFKFHHLIFNLLGIEFHDFFKFWFNDSSHEFKKLIFFLKPL
jgi:hypothetical protein